VRLEGLLQLINLMNSSGMEPVTFRIVAQCLNQLRYHVSCSLFRILIIIVSIIGLEFTCSYETGATNNYHANPRKIIVRSRRWILTVYRCDWTCPVVAASRVTRPQNNGMTLLVVAVFRPARIYGPYTVSASTYS
jgi:hypothetical protein